MIDPTLGYATFIGAGADDTASGITSHNGNAFIVGTTTNSSMWDPDDYDPTNEIRPQLKLQGGFNPWSRDAFVARLDPDGHLLNLTFIGGNNTEEGAAIALDASDNIYITGQTDSFDFPASGNAWQGDLATPPLSESGVDGFVAKLPADGSTLLYGTYFDFSNFADTGSCPPSGPPDSDTGCYFHYREFPGGIAVNGSHIYVSGVADADTPVVPSPAGQIVPPAVDTSKEGAFVVDLTNPSALEQGDQSNVHFFGGSFDTGAEAYLTDVVAANNKVYVGGNMCNPSTFDPITPTAFQNAFHGFCDGFVAVLDEGTLAPSYITLLGAQGRDAVHSIAVLPNGDVYATGFVSNSIVQTIPCVSCDLPPTVGGATVQGFTDAFVLHLAFAGGIPSWLRLVGGESNDYGNAIAVDANSTPYITGETQSVDFPTTPAGTRDTDDSEAFVTLVAKDGSAPVFSRYYGSDNSTDIGTGIWVASDGIYLCGWTRVDSESDPVFPFPNTHTVQFDRGGLQDAFAARFVNDPLVLTPLASTVTPGTVIPFTATGGVGFGYVFTFAQNQSVATLSPATPNVSNYTAGINVGNDIVRVTDAAGNVATGNVTVFQGGQSSSSGTVGGSELILNPMVISIAPKGTIQFNASGGTPPYQFALVTNASNGTVAATTGQYHAGPRGSVTDRVRVTDSGGQSKTATINVTEAITITPPSATLAQNQHQHFTATGGKGAPYTWSADKGTITAAGDYTAPLENTVAKVTATDGNGNTATATIAVGSAIAISQDSEETFPKGTVQFTALGGAGGYHYAVITNPPVGGSINGDTGLFTAGTTGDVTETIDVKDTAERHASATVRVGPSLTITPSGGTPEGNTQIQFSAAGGSGQGYSFTLETSQSGASINSATGLYTAGPNAGQDVVKLVDSVGNEARATLSVTAAPNNGGNGNGNGNGNGASSGGAGASSSSGGNRITVGDNGGGDDGCSVGSVGGSSSSTTALAGFGLGLMLLARRRRSKKLDS
ncbi:MAG: hypothetical protein U0270_07975 [Labilithrix sp.]